jgi:hypothetical protein
MKNKRSKIDLPTTRGGQTISLDLSERTIYQAMKKAGEEGLTAGKVRDLLGYKFAETTILRICERLCGYGLAGKERAGSGSTVYRALTRKPGPKPKPRIGELRCYQCVRHPRLSIRNDAKFIDGLFETTNLATQELIESSGDFGVMVVRISPEEAQTARIAARAERDRLVHDSTVRS